MNAQEAIKSDFESMIADGETIPTEAHPTIATTVIVMPGEAA